MRTAIAVYGIDYQLILHNHTPPPFGHLLYLRGGVLIRFRILTHPLVISGHYIDYIMLPAVCYHLKCVTFSFAPFYCAGNLCAVYIGCVC